MTITIFSAAACLKHGYEISTHCGCGLRYIDVAKVVEGGYGDLEFPELRARLRCSKCGVRGSPIQITPRCNPATGLPLRSQER